MRVQQQASLMPPMEQRAQIPAVGIPRSTFDRSHGHKTTLNSGWLVPFYRDEVLPGDTINFRAHTFARFATLLAPIMDNVWATTFYFFVPNRLLWNNWERFLGSQDNPNDSTNFVTPKIQPGPGGFSRAEGASYANGIMDYLGVEPEVANTLSGWTANAFYTRAYNLIWNDWFRDENLQPSRPVDLDDGPDDPADYTLMRRGRRHDYFTSCLPWPQKGTALRIPIGTSAPLVLSGTNTTGILRNASTGAVFGVDDSLKSSSLGNLVSISGGTGLFYDPNGTLVANTTNLGGTINELRMAEAIQTLLERDARGGTRYTELIRQHFGVVSDDARLQRPELLGMGRQNINVAAIAQTSESGSTPQGNLAAQATFGGDSGGFVRSFTEHGVVIGLICIDADQNYQAGMDRSFMRSTKYDYYWPALQNIGEQVVYANEIGLSDITPPTQPFGYNERYADYKIGRNRISAQMRSSATNSYDQWHLAEDYGISVPTLNAAFIQAQYPIQRVVAVDLNTAPEFILDAHFKISHVRAMAVHSIPGARL